MSPWFGLVVALICIWGALSEADKGKYGVFFWLNSALAVINLLLVAAKVLP